MATFEEYLKQKQQAQKTAPREPSGFEQFQQQRNSPAKELPQAQPFQSGKLEGKYLDDVDYTISQNKKDNSEKGSILRSLFSQPIGVGQFLAEKTKNYKQNVQAVSNAQTQQRSVGAQVLQQRGVIPNEEEYTQQNAQKMLDRIKNSNVDDRQKALMAGIINDSFDTNPLPPPKTPKQALGDILGTALFVVPVGEAIGILRGASIGATAIRGAVAGVAVGTTVGMSEDEDLPGIIKSAALGGAVGAPLEAGVGLAIRGAGKVVTTAKEKIGVPKFLQSIGSRLQKDFGEQGKLIYDKVITADNNTLNKVGGRMEEQHLSGLFDLDDAASRRLTLALEGHIAPDEQILPAFKAFDKARKEIADEAMELGVKVRVKGGDFSFAGLTKQLDSGDLTKMDVKASKLGPKGAKEVPFKPRENFLRHYTPSTEELKDGAIRQATIENSVANGTFESVEQASKVLDSYVDLIEGGARKNTFWEEHLVKTGQAKDLTEAQGKTLRFFKESRINRSGSLEKAREIDFPFYDPDARRVIPAYLMEATTRLEEIKVFGPKLEEIDKLIGQYVDSAQRIQGATKGADSAKELRFLVNRMRGVVESTPQRDRANIFLRTLQLPKLAFAQVLNVGQNVNTLLAADTPSFLRGIGYAFTKEGYARALKSGAILESVMKENGRLVAGTRFGEKLLKYTGFTSTEKFNRVVSANAGISYAQSTARKLVKNPSSKVLRARLQELGINPESILSQGITERDLMMAGQKMSEITQFRSRPVDLPAFVQSPEGKTIFQFKSFAYQQTKFLKDRLKAQTKIGNYGGIARDLIILGTVFPMTGEVVGDIRSLITGTTRPTDALDRYLEDITMVGGLGIMVDVFVSAGWGRLAEWIIGPTAGTAVEGTERLVKSVKSGEFEKGDAKYLLNQTGFGRVVSNYLFPTDREGRETFLKTLQEEL
jgi:hypothetical protein